MVEEYEAAYRALVDAPPAKREPAAAVR
jgi:hypothetical protein